jgi:hypothetical protein
MNKKQIYDELTLCIEILEVLENVLLVNKLKRIKQSLTNEWDLSDFYMDAINKELYYNEQI